MSKPKPFPDVAAAVEQYGAMISKPKAAEVLGCSVRTIGRMIEAGDLPLYQIGRTRTLRVKTADVLALVKQVA